MTNLPDRTFRTLQTFVLWKRQAGEADKQWRPNERDTITKVIARLNDNAPLLVEGFPLLPRIGDDENLDERFISEPAIHKDDNTPLSKSVLCPFCPHGVMHPFGDGHDFNCPKCGSYQRLE